MKYKVYDISQELINSSVYPGDPRPKLEILNNMNNGDLYNLSSLHMCLHNGTHIDAPKHFINNAKSVEEVDINKFIGFCYVASFNDIINKDDVKVLMDEIIDKYDESITKILLKGNCIVSTEAAETFLSYGVDLIGTELVSVGDPNAPMLVHQILLSKEVVLLEGIRLGEVEDGIYFLNSAPLSIKNAEGSPCRAILIKFLD